MDDGSHQMTGEAGGVISRARLLAAVATCTTGILLPTWAGTARADGPRALSFPYYPHVAGTYTPELVPDILNVLVTFERLRATQIMTVLRTDISRFDPITVSFIKAAAMTSMLHTEFWESMGGQTLETGYAALPKLAQGNVVVLQSEFVGAAYTALYMTAAREFAELGQPTLVKWAYQAGTTYAETRVLARVLATELKALDERPPNNKVFETDHFLYTRDAYQLYRSNGAFGPHFAYPYPGHDAIVAAASSVADSVIQRVPNDASVSTTSQGAIDGERGATP